MRTLLREGDYIHFYAEQRHWAVNAADHSVLFIIRFYQMDEEFLRQQMRREVERQMGARRPTLAPLTLGWVHQAIANRSVDEPDEVHDKVGLARLLTALRQPPFSDPRREISTIVENAGYRGMKIAETEGWLSSLEASHGKASKKDLAEIAKLYGVESFLLYSFLFPGKAWGSSVSRCVHPTPLMEVNRPVVGEAPWRLESNFRFAAMMVFGRLVGNHLDFSR
jgi:hypothetical protein